MFMDGRSLLSDAWEQLWRLDRRTRRALRMDPTALLDYSQLSPEERDLADRLASDGGAAIRSGLDIGRRFRFRHRRRRGGRERRP
jgi:hypothetical protein